VASSKSFERVPHCLQHAKFSSIQSALDRIIMDKRKPTVETNTTSSIRVDHRDNQSSSATSQRLLKTFASLVLRLPQTPYTGSPRLTSSKVAEKMCYIVETLVDETWIYTLLPLDSGGEKRRRVSRTSCIALQAEDFEAQPIRSIGNCAELCSKLPQYEINLVSYLLVSKSTASATVPHL
jgi:hypothetical protein